MQTPTAEQVLRYIDYFAGQENTAEEVRDFVQKCARFLDEQVPQIQWETDNETSEFFDWCQRN